jgi:hypothetical protein
MIRSGTYFITAIGLGLGHSPAATARIGPSLARAMLPPSVLAIQHGRIS